MSGNPCRHTETFLEDLLVRVHVATVVRNEPHQSVVQPLGVVRPSLALDERDLRVSIHESVFRNPNGPGPFGIGLDLDVVLDRT